MTTEQRNIIIAAIAIVLIGGGLYYYKKNQQLPPFTLPSGEEEVVIPAPAEGGNATVSQPTTSASSPSGGKITTGVTGANEAASIKLKFDTAMANASKASLKGDYALALKYYNDALLLQKRDVVYSGMFNVYTAQQNWSKALEVLNKAIDLNPRYTEYWKWKLTLLDEKTGASYTELKQVYEIGLAQGDARTAINIVTHFAVMAEANNEKSEAIALWEYAKTLNPTKASIYQAEIDRLKTI